MLTLSKWDNFKLNFLYKLYKIVQVDESTAISDIGEVAKLKVSARRASKAAKRLQEEVKTVESSLSEAKNKVTIFYFFQSIKNIDRSEKRKIGVCR